MSPAKQGRGEVNESILMGRSNLGACVPINAKKICRETFFDWISAFLQSSHSITPNSEKTKVRFPLISGLQ